MPLIRPPGTFSPHAGRREMRGSRVDRKSSCSSDIREIGMGRLAGKVAIVTAAAARIGRASAVAMAREGAKVFAADIDEAGLGKLKAENNTIETLTLDVCDAAKVRAAREQTGPVDVLVNCS